MKNLLVLSLISIPLLLSQPGCDSESISDEQDEIGADAGPQDQTLSLCEEVIDHTQPCCDLTPDEVDVGKTACAETTFSAAQIELLECTLASTCDELLNGGACGGLTCNN